MAGSDFSGFHRQTFSFLEDLAQNNQRDWFQEHKQRYETDVLQPAQAFVRAMAPALKRISPMLVASDRRGGGSLMRIYRDTRFSQDKTPYKTNIGIQFRHEMGKDVHAPGCYLHIAPQECFLGAGMWMPETKVLTQIREAIVDDPPKWKRIRDGKRFRQHCDLAGEQLKTAPRGFDKEHKYIDDLRRTSFIGVKNLTRKDVMTDSFLKDVSTAFAASKAFMVYLCQATGVPF